MIRRLHSFLEILSRFIARLWLTVLYSSVMLPFGIVARIRAARQAPAAPEWRERDNSITDVSRAQRQF
jgi:hypothetical protein